MAKYVLIILGLIGLYLLVTNGAAVQNLVGTLADASLRGAVVLQGRSPREVL